ncbi:MAG TPA: methylated-DNA--[protein]-cysteine S-methyltransferase [Gammaproteobacteria bacterium]|nr:methylated-DNA--[protein]-cysteine S-methyltransferase [Gammaproteobacteria bacterium]
MKELRSLQSLPVDAIYDEMDTPVGQLTLIASKQALHAILWESNRKDAKCQKIIQDLKQSQDHKIIIQTKKQLTEYFQGKRKIFDIPLILRGTDFQVKAWEQLQKIPYAKTISYAEQAARIGDKNKARAVGMANGLNPISIIVPCHRVIGSNGHLVGFGGGIENKAYLLKLELNKK